MMLKIVTLIIILSNDPYMAEQMDKDIYVESVSMEITGTMPHGSITTSYQTCRFRHIELLR